ncbi:hypothetical protein EXS71_03040 [Candidatus Uhrbacteria bacterium]|nr:hypothetical protein [Candidatus Uhrbacteria bacterium]
MSTLSVPLTAQLDTFVKQMVHKGFGANKADVVRRALTRLAEDEAIFSVLRSEQELKEGKALHGNLHKLLKALP